MAEAGAVAAAVPATGSGAALVERALQDLAQEDDLCVARPVKWDSSLAEVSQAVKTRIPAIVEERCKEARHRANCGLIPAARQAWASADALLHLWDYRSENPEVVLLPADSTIVTVAACPPRPGIFGAAVDLLLVVCTRTSVSLWGLQFPIAGAAAGFLPLQTPAAGGPFGAAPGASAAGLPAQPAPLLGGALGQPPAASTALAAAQAAGVGARGPLAGAVKPGFKSSPGRDSLRVVALEGYVARTDGVLFHCVANTDDGHILLACGTPQLYELAYSRTPGWFHSKCRLVQHTTGLRSRVRDLLSFSAAVSGRIRLLACAPHDYVVTVDDSSTIRLLGIRDHTVHRVESVAVVQELASLSIGELSQQLFEQTKVHLASRVLTHIFPAIGLDRHLRLHVVTAASERLLLLCSRAVPLGGGEDARQSHVEYGFWLQHATECSGGSSTSSSGPLSTTGLSSLLAGSAARSAAARRVTCLEENRDPCSYACGVWVAASHRPGVAVTELGISVRIGDSAEGDDLAYGGGAKSLYTALRLDAPVLDIAEEVDANPATGCPVLSNRGLEGEPAAFRGNRSFAVLLQHSVQVIHLGFKAQTLGHPPANAAECCQHLVGLTSPSLGDPSRGSAELALERAWGWTFDDVWTPSFEELQRCIAAGEVEPPIGLGKWFSGLLRFLALVLRPIWTSPLVVPLKGQLSAEMLPWQRQEGALALALDEAAVRRLLARLRPALRFARQGLAPLAPPRAGAQAAASAVPMGSAARAQLYTQGRAASTEGAAQAQRTLRCVLEVADRAQQVLGLLSVLHSHRNAYRVLRSGVLAGAALESLVVEPVSKIVASPEGMAPAVQLCSALVVESGLATPSAGTVFNPQGTPQPLGAKPPEGSAVAAELCRDLEEHCPGIFAQVDLRYMQSRLTSTGGGSGGELLQRYAQCVSSASQEDQWVALSSGVRTMAVEDPRAAVDVCVGKLHQLQPDAATGLQCARVLLEGLLEALAWQPKSQPKAAGIPSPSVLVEHLLTKTASLKIGQVEGQPNAVHGIILDCLLKTKRMHSVLEAALLGTSAADVEAFLLQRCPASSAAGDLLWKYYIKQGKPAKASEVLLKLAERGEDDIGLPERTKCLDLALQAAGRAQNQAAVDKLKAQLEVAVRVQVPLQRELRLLAGDEHVSRRWRELAEQRSRALGRLVSLQALYETANEFGLSHLVLIIADIASNVQDKEMISMLWVHVLFPPAGSPYSPAEIAGAETMQRQLVLFPLLTLRRSTQLILKADDAPPSPLPPVAKLEDLRIRSTRLIHELVEVTQAQSSIWSPQSVVGVLEYANCLWHRSFLLDEPQGMQGAGVGKVSVAEADAPAPSNARLQTGQEPSSAVAVESGQAPERAWVALKVLTRAPFSMTHLSVLRFYEKLMETVRSWSKDLEACIPADSTGRRPAIEEADLCTHLAEVVLLVVDSWASQVESAKPSDRDAVDFCGAVPAVEGVLSSVRKTLETGRQRGKLPVHAQVKRLLAEVDRLEATGRRIHGRAAPSGSNSLPLAGGLSPPSSSAPAAATAAGSSGGLFSDSALAPAAAQEPAGHFLGFGR